MTQIMEKIKEFNRERDWEQFHTPENLSKSIVIEAAELLEHFQWGEPFDQQAVEEELADVMLYCLQLAQTLGVDPIRIMDEKMDKNARKYPVDKARGSAAKYDKL